MDRNTSHSVPHKRRGLTVEPSPLNHIKLELGLMLCIAVVLLLVAPRLSDDTLVQLGLLSGFGLAFMVRIVFRVRQVVRRHGPEDDNGQK